MLKLKKTRILFTVILVLVIFISGYATSTIRNLYLEEKESLVIEYDDTLPEEINNARTQDIVYINDTDLYALQCEDILNHYDYYENKVINITGYCTSKIEEDNVEHYYIGKIISDDGNECPLDANAALEAWHGFEVISDTTLPTPNEHITIEGVFGEYKIDDEDYMAILDCHVVP